MFAGSRQHCWLPRTLLRLFLLVVPASTCTDVNGIQEERCGNTEQGHPNWANLSEADAAAATRAAKTAIEVTSETSWLPRPSDDKACTVNSLSLVQLKVAPSRKISEEEEEPIEDHATEGAKETPLVDEIRKKEASLQGRPQSVQGHPLVRMPTFKLDHTAGKHDENNTNRGLQPVSQRQVLSRNLASDANHAMAFVPFSSNRSWLNMSIQFEQLRSSYHSGAISAFRHVTAASTRIGEIDSWVFIAALFFVATILVCVSISGKGNSSSGSSGSTRTISGPIWTPREHLGSPGEPPGSLRRPLQRGATSSRLPHPITPQAASLLPHSSMMLPGSLPELTSQPVLKQRRSISGQEGAVFCPELVVPQSCESCLRVPIHPTPTFSVTDVKGNQVLRVELQVGQTFPHERRRVALTAMGGFLIAQCAATPVQGGTDEYQLLRGNGEYFGTIFQANLEERPSCPGLFPTWTIRTGAGVEWFFRGYFDSYAVDISDNLGRILAVSQREDVTEREDSLSNVGEAYLVRVAPQMDVSIVLCGLLAIHHLL